MRRNCTAPLSRPVKRALAGLLLFAALWTLAELCRGQLFTGFPWGAIGYAHVDSPLRHWLPWVGVYGVSAISAFACMVVTAKREEHIENPSRIGWGIRLSLLVALAYTWTSANTRQAAVVKDTSQQALKVALVQGNVPQDLKFGVAVPQSLADYRKALLANTADFIALPETALPVLADNLPEHFWGELKQHFAQNQQLALIGIPMREAGPTAQGLLTNSAMALMPSATDANYRYDKHHLVPFGEYVPPFFQWFVRMMNMPLGDFAQDRPPAGVLKWQGQRLLPQICYEDLFGEEMARYFVKPEEAPTVFVNMSNLAWFGDTTAIPQHVAISRMRAMEFQRPILRATNTGLTGLVDAKGEVTASLPNFTRGALVLEFEGRVGLTPYAQWTSQWGLAPLWWLCIAIVLIFGVVSWRSGPRAL